jgi:hypothetical protein
MAHRLEEVKASRVHIEPEQVIFKVNVFRLVSSWNVLVLFDSGTLQIQGTSLRYEVSVQRVVLSVAVVVSLWAMSIISSHDWQTWLTVATMCGCVLGLNLLIAVFRFREFLLASVAAAPRLAGPQCILPLSPELTRYNQESGTNR